MKAAEGPGVENVPEIVKLKDPSDYVPGGRSEP